mmetsp:Transcript_57578/g.171700  ORF Transcript_57578/g.171700 Transcript_57578/m.171700 type:complete len:624 (-) Transcript_57578:123-1994(-)
MRGEGTWIIAFLLRITAFVAGREGAFSHSTKRVALDSTPTRTPCRNGLVVDPLFTEITPDQYSGPLPKKFAYPFCYDPHPVSVWAADRLREQLQSSSGWNGPGEETCVGKMFGVLVVRTSEEKLGYLKAYSGTLPSTTATTPTAPGTSLPRSGEDNRGNTQDDGFVPVVYNRFDEGGFFKRGEAELNSINADFENLENSPERAKRKAHLTAMEEDHRETLAETRKRLKAKKEKRRQQRSEMRSALDSEKYQTFDARMVQESNADQRHLKSLKARLKNELSEAQESVDEIEGRLEHLRNLRQKKSARLQNQLFEQYQFLNIRGEKQSLLPIFADTPLQRPPAGAGDCAAPKLFQHAFSKGYKPIALAEFWWGKPPALEVRKHNFYYPCCRGKCEPVLGHMLKGLAVEDTPLNRMSNELPKVEIIYEDAALVLVNKPNEMLSVPGRLVEHSVYTEMKKRYPESTGPLLVHRLDMSTSGILVVAKDKEIHKQIQSQFIARSVKKRYTALLEGEVNISKGKIDLPLTPDYLHRPQQKVDYENGKPASTFFEVVEISNSRTRINFYPITGRTHQLRVHAAHDMGLGTPIVGDDIYGQRDERLFLHAGFLEIMHPITKKRMTFTADAPF